MCEGMLLLMFYHMLMRWNGKVLEVMCCSWYMLSNKESEFGSSSFKDGFSYELPKLHLLSHIYFVILRSHLHDGYNNIGLL